MQVDVPLFLGLVRGRYTGLSVLGGFAQKNLDKYSHSCYIDFVRFLTNNDILYSVKNDIPHTAREAAI